MTIFLFPFCALAILPALQARIVALAGGAPNLAAASIHAAFNIANSLGAWLGGITIAAGLGYGGPQPRRRGARRDGPGHRARLGRRAMGLAFAPPRAPARSAAVAVGVRPRLSVRRGGPAS